MVVTVAELWLPPPPITFKPFLTAAAEPFPAPAEAARNLTIEATRRLQTIFPTWDIRAEALVGSPYARERGDGRSGARALLGRSRPHEKECVMENSPDEMLRQVVGAIGNEVQPSAAVHSLK